MLSGMLGFVTRTACEPVRQTETKKETVNSVKQEDKEKVQFTAYKKHGF